MNLIERLEKATGPDRRIDADLWMASDASLSPDFNRDIGIIAVARIKGGGDDSECPAYTASIDAALTLVPEGTDLELYFDNPKRRGDDNWLSWLAQIGTTDGRFIQGKSDHGAIALCIAALKALATSTTPEHKP